MLMLSIAISPTNTNAVIVLPSYSNIIGLYPIVSKIVPFGILLVYPVSISFSSPSLYIALNLTPDKSSASPTLYLVFVGADIPFNFSTCFFTTSISKLVVFSLYDISMVLFSTLLNIVPFSILDVYPVSTISSVPLSYITFNFNPVKSNACPTTYLVFGKFSISISSTWCSPTFMFRTALLPAYLIVIVCCPLVFSSVPSAGSHS